MTDGVDHRALSRYAELAIEKRDADARRREIMAEMDAIRPGLLEQFATNGVQSINLKDAGTCYLHESGWVKTKRVGAKATPEEIERGIDALKAAGYGDLIAEKWNTQTLSAIWREWLRDGITPNSALRNAFEFEVTTDIRVRG